MTIFVISKPGFVRHVDNDARHLVLESHLRGRQRRLDARLHGHDQVRSRVVVAALIGLDREFRGNIPALLPRIIGEERRGRIDVLIPRNPSVLKSVPSKVIGLFDTKSLPSAAIQTFRSTLSPSSKSVSVARVEAVMAAGVSEGLPIVGVMQRPVARNPAFVLQQAAKHTAAAAAIIKIFFIALSV